ncbi:MAG: hypothetical protein Q9188_005947 [Gyalolechia gomerana]
MSAVLVQFMEQDQLGRMAGQHQILADQFSEGTLHQHCIQLAEFHFIAVNFFKTGSGLVIHESQLTQRRSKNMRYRPDVTAPERRVKTEEHETIFDAKAINIQEKDDPRRVGHPGRQR